MTDANLDQLLAALEARLGRLEARLAALGDTLERMAPDLDAAKRIQAWVTDYVSLRLQQLVPETCEHPERDAATAIVEGPVLPGTRIRCTEEVIHRLRVPRGRPRARFHRGAVDPRARDRRPARDRPVAARAPPARRRVRGCSTGPRRLRRDHRPPPALNRVAGPSGRPSSTTLALS